MSAIREMTVIRGMFPEVRMGRGLIAGAATVLLLGTSLFAILVHASLYADGAYYFLHIVSSHGFWFVARERIAANVLTQALLVVGLHVGLHSMQTAVLLYSAGALGIPALIYLLALFFSRGEWYLPVVATVTITIYPATFFASFSESVVTYPVYLLIAVVLASSRPLTVTRAVTLLLCSAVLPLLYETSVVFGPVLAVWSMRRFRHDGDKAMARAALLVLMLAAIAASLTAAWAILYPAYSQADNGAGSLFGVWSSHEFDAACLVLAGIVVLAAGMKRPVVIAAAEAIVLGAAALFTAVGSATPDSQYTIRLAPALILLPLFIVLWRPDGWRGIHLRSFTGSRTLSYAAITLAAALMIQNATLLWGWHDFFHSLQHQVNASHGVVAYASARPDLAVQYGWTWTFPTMSRIAQESPRGALIENPSPSHWQPFDPARGEPRADNLYWRT